jgi:hypothetical protein
LSSAKVSEKKRKRSNWQLSEELRVSEYGSWQNNLKEIARKELGCAKKTS